MCTNTRQKTILHVSTAHRICKPRSAQEADLELGRPARAGAHFDGPARTQPRRDAKVDHLAQVEHVGAGGIGRGEGAERAQARSHLHVCVQLATAGMLAAHRSVCTMQPARLVQCARARILIAYTAMYPTKQWLDSLCALLDSPLRWGWLGHMGRSSVWC